MRKNFHLGFDYYPEHWPEERWEKDLEMMRDCGTTCIRIAEFAWTRMEPKEGEFTFDWLERFYSLAAKHEISIILGTPTAAPPPWAWQTYPDIVTLQNDGQRCSTTWRRYVCPTSPNYARLCDAITEQMAQRLGDHPQTIGWQTDNEISGALCYCEHCQAACREWLREKYGSVERLNADQGNVFWAHEVTDWDQVILPRAGMDSSRTNPSVRLDVRRFFSEAWRRFAARQIEIIRRHSPERWITHNLPGFAVNLDLYDFAATHDFLSIDFYPKATIDPPSRVSFANDLTRSLQDRPHWVMEVQTGTPCTKFYKAPVPREGQLAVYAHQSAAHGAEGVVFFRWRKSPAGSEMFGNGLLDHDGRPRRQYGELQGVGRDFAQLAEALPDYDAPKEVAVVFDYPDRVNAAVHDYAMDVDYFGHLKDWWGAATALGLNVRLVRSTDDLSPYKIVAAPNQFTTSPEIVENFTRYVQGGGTLIGALRMGVFDVFGKPSCMTLPGGMTELFGAEVEEYERVMAPNPNRVIFGDDVGGHGECHGWNYYLNDLGARALGAYEGQFYAGKTAVSLNEFGQGRAVYVGTRLDDEARARLMACLASQAGLETLPKHWPEDVERVRLRDDEGNNVHALVNHADQPRRIALAEPALDLISGESCQEFEMPALSARWLRI
jgi:beta-galactosidase